MQVTDADLSTMMKSVSMDLNDAGTVVLKTTNLAITNALSQKPARMHQSALSGT